MELEASTFSLKTVAQIVNCSFKEKFGTPRQGVLISESKAFIKLESWVPHGSLVGLEGFSHLWLVWVFHKNGPHKLKGKVHAPRLAGQSVGVFASRSPHRPNPIGLSLVKLESVEEKGFWVSGVDLIEGTPILDIKPYIAEDLAPSPNFGWIDNSMIPKRQITWLTDLNSVNELKSEEVLPLKNLIEATLSLDPRPVIYKQLEQTQGYKGPYGIVIDNFNVQFTSSPSGFEIVSVTSENTKPSTVHHGADHEPNGSPPHRH